MKKYPFVHQRENKDCGVSCLSMIIKYYGGCINEDILYDITQTSKRGTSAYNLIEAAKSVGLKASGIKCDIDQLKNLKYPCIAHVTLEKNIGHYIVIYNINWKRRELYIGDPARKRMKIKIDEFKNIFTGVLITMEKEKTLPVYSNDLSLIKYIKVLINTYKKDWIIIWIESLICLLFSIITSLYMATMLKGIQLNSKKWISYTIITFVFLSLVKNIITLIQSKMTYKVELKINTHLMIQAIKNIVLLPYKFYCNRSTGDITSRIQDLEKVGYELSQIMTLLFIDSTIALVSGVILYNIKKEVFMIIIIWILIYIVIVYLYRKIIDSNLDELKQGHASLYNKILETIKGFETIKGLQLEHKQIQNISKNYIDYSHKLCHLKLIETKQNNWKNVISDIGYILICGLCSIEVVNGNMELTHILICQTLIAYFLLPVEHILTMNSSICDMEKTLKRSIEIIYPDEDKKELKCPKIKKIRVQNLSYEHDNNVLKNISFELKSNEKVILMGSSGSGKSTLLKLLRGYYDTLNGKIYINNIDINYFTKESLAKRITYISQNEILFTDTIYDNIKMDRNYNENQIIKQLKINYIDDITRRKKIGLQDIIEENGYNLSGGERQRIILARSLLKNSDVIMIDEGFSQMDRNLERSILKEIFKKYHSKMIIVVSHRKDNMDLFDRYIELKNGKIHTNLSKRN